jgi:hypothetical protein
LTYLSLGLGSGSGSVSYWTNYGTGIETTVFEAFFVLYAGSVSLADEIGIIFHEPPFLSSIEAIFFMCLSKVSSSEKSPKI